jgi:hypothetical protein
VVVSPKLYIINNRLLKSVVIFFAFIFLFTTDSFAQITDTTASAKKTVNSDSLPHIKYKHPPKLAALMSTILPGAGQVYNKKYWKVPIIYAGLAGLAYSYNFNHTKYVDYRDAYKLRLEGITTPNNYPRYSDDNLNTLQLYYHRFTNLSAIGITVLYALNIVDACVDAHMFTFDVGDNLSLNLQPSFINTTALNHYTTGLALSIKF